MTVENKLLEMKKEIQDETDNLNRYEGQLETTLDNLKTDFKEDNIDNCDTLLNEMNTEINELETELKSETDKLEEGHEWNFLKN